ncbi:hypothetical protein BJ741DRAFT_634408 [Chytriomyces cf. hyalinus JEL632]|nr:hypothetical protein BJ741DRAFT_634408 [Chytriomyces cf. hyalinus JEL632]
MYSVQLGSFTFPEGDTVIGRGWNGVVDAQLSRKQLRISVDTHAGTLNATRLAQNPSRVRRAAPAAAENPASKLPESDLPQNTPFQLFHGDTLFLVGGKYPFLVSIARNDAIAAGTMTMTLPFQSTLMHSVTVLHNKNEPASQSLLRSNSILNAAEVVRDEEVGAEAAALQQEERRWTDDEDDDHADTAGGHHGSKHGARKVRLHRRDFSDESPDVSPFDGESDSAMSSNSPSVSESLVPKTPRKGLAKKPALKRPRKLKSVKSTITGSDSELDQLVVDKNRKRGDKLESESDVSVAGSKPAKSRMPARSIRTRSDLNIVGGVSTVTADERKRLVLELREKRRKRTAGKEPMDAERDSGEEEDQISNLASEGSNRLRKLTSFRTIEDSSRNKNDVKKQRRVTAYGLYAKTERKKVKSEHPSAASSEITKILKTRFSLLSNEQKNTYQSWAASKNRDSDSSPGSNSDDPSEVSRTAGKEANLKPTPEIAFQNDSETSGSEEIPLARTRKDSVAHTPVKKNHGYHPSSHSGDGNDSGDASGGMSPVLL